MWHMLKILISPIFCSEISHDQVINVVYLFCSDLLLFSRKFAKTVQNSDHFKYQHKNFAPGKCKSKFSLLFLCICMEGIGKSIKPKTRIFPLNLNSQQVFKKHQYFLISKSNLETFFQDTFYLCGITPNYLRLTL